MNHSATKNIRVIYDDRLRLFIWIYPYMKELVIFVSLVSRVCFQIISIQVLAEYSISGQT